MADDTAASPRVSAHGLYCGIKRDASREDLGLVLADRDCVAAGVYTQNQVVAAPVLLDRERTPADKIRAVIVNSGNANACTGPQGLENARQMARLAAQACGVHDEQVLVLSTGIIGEQLPLEKIARGIEQLVPRLGHDEASLTAVARAMMTTDTRQKLSGRSVKHGAGSYQITGMAKGAAMIGPRMATMLAVVLTDAPLRVRDAQDALVDAVQDSFNCISVEGHMSTNDTVLLLANGAAGRSVSERHRAGRLPTVAARGLRGIGAIDSRRRRRGHPSDRDRRHRVPQPRRSPPDCPIDRRQRLGEDRHRRRRSQLGPHRLGRRLCRRGL